MPRRRVQETGRFLAEDEDGAVYTIVKWSVFTEHAPVAGPPQWVRGSTRHTLDDGTSLELRKDGTFEVDGTSKIIRKI